MSEVHYFQRYSQKENVVTNNTLLLLLRLREFSQVKFETMMADLFVDESGQFGLPQRWLTVRQQAGTGSSIPDGFIAQPGIKIVIETKLGKEFDPSQLENHLRAFDSEVREKHQILLLLTSTRGESFARDLTNVSNLARKKGIQVQSLLFSEIIDAAKGEYGQNADVMALIEDYEEFCRGEGLLPRDEFTMFVPPCGKSYELNLRYSLYFCPSDWRRKVSKYIGIYKDKRVQAIGRVANVVTCKVDLKTGRLEVASGSPKPSAEEKERILGVTEGAKKRGWDLQSGRRFYLFDRMERTEFKKMSPGGIQGHRYFDLEDVLGEQPSDDLAVLASQLKDKTWR